LPVARQGAGVIFYDDLPAPLATETRDERIRRAAVHPRHTDSEIRRLYEPAPSSELREAAGAAVQEVFIEDMSRRLDLIAEAASELGGEIGIRIRALAGVGTKIPDASTAARPFPIRVRAHTPALGGFLRTGSEEVVVAAPVVVGETPPDDGAALLPSPCPRCPGIPHLRVWVKGKGFTCPRCDDPERRRGVLPTKS
jgi:hypothetical protein